MQRCNSQVCVLCHLCDGHLKLKWRCMDCMFTICDKCKDIHSRIPASSNHTVISFDDISMYNIDQRLERMVKSMSCRRHSKRTYTFFCRSCEFLVCTDCVFEIHSKHNITEIMNFINEKYTSTTEDAEHFDENSLTESAQEGDDIYDCNEQDFEIINMHVADEPYYLLMASFEVVHTISTNFPMINFVIPMGDDMSYIGCTGSDISKIRMNTTGFINRNLKRSSCTQIYQIQGFQPTDVTASPSEEIYFLCRTENCVMMATKNSRRQTQVCDIYNFSSMVPICINCDQEDPNTIWVGLKEEGPDFIMGKNSIRQVVAITTTGKLSSVLEHTSEKKPLFTFPCRIRKISKRNICVVDRLSETSGRVISLDKSGHVMWIYDNPCPSYCQFPFFPTDAAVMKSQNIIISDSANSSLHVLNSNGVPIAYQPLTECGIELPLCLNFDKAGYLWLGCASNPYKREKHAKMYKIEISGL